MAKSFGGRIAEVRRECRWSQRQLADRVGTTQTRICRFEQGDPATFDLELAVAVCDELGISPNFGLDAPVFADRRPQRNAAHARCVAHVAGRLRAMEWLAETEVEVGRPPWLGWIDVLAYHPIREVVLIQEVKTELHDAGGEQRRLSRYERDVVVAARERGWQPRRIVTGIALLWTSRNDERLGELRELLRVAFPIRAPLLMDFLADPSIALPSGRSIALIDPRSRRSEWLRPTRLDGRRTPAPYRDYADFASRIRA